jgi:predicted DNA-binding protein
MAKTIPKRKKLHVPLEEGLYRRLRAEANRTGRPATQLARDAIDRYLAELRRAALHEEIASYAAAAAGTRADLDPGLESAGADHLHEGVEEDS